MSVFSPTSSTARLDSNTNYRPHDERASNVRSTDFTAAGPDTAVKSKNVYNQDGGILGDAYYKFTPKTTMPAFAVDPVVQQQLYAKSIDKNRATGYADAPYIADSLLSQVYFSAENEQIIQNGLREGVYSLSLLPEHKGPPFLMPPQNAVAVKSVMRGIFMQHYTDRISPDATITDQVSDLNDLVWKHAVPRLYTQAMNHLYFINQFEKPVQTQDMPRPELYDRDWKKGQMPSPFL